MKWLTVLLIYIKRRFKSPAFIVSALLVFLLVPLSSALSAESEASYKTGFYIEDSGELASEIEGEKGGVSLISYDSYDALARDVENKTLICGYILPTDIVSVVAENRARSITRLVSPSSVLTELADEALFAAVAEVCTDEVMGIYLTEKEIEYDSDELESQYNELMGSQAYSYIEYEYRDAAVDTREAKDAPLDPLSGLIGIYIMLGGVLSINVWIRDREKGVPHGAVNIAAAVVLLTLFAGAAVIYSGQMDTEYALKLVLYGILLMGYCTLIGQLCSSTAFVCGLLPVLILGSLAVCPIAVDFSSLVPPLKYVSYIFAPSYFVADMSVLAVGAFLFTLVSILIYLIKEKLFVC